MENLTYGNDLKLLIARRDSIPEIINRLISKNIDTEESLNVLNYWITEYQLLQTFIDFFFSSDGIVTPSESLTGETLPSQPTLF